MRKFIYKAVFLCVIVACFGMLTIGCSREQEQTRDGWSDTHTANCIRASYDLFDGYEYGYINVETGQTFIIRYDVKVESGNLRVKIESPWGENVWQQYIKHNSKKEFAVQVTSNGRHKVMIIGDDTKGSFDVSWEKIDPKK